jgi:glycosyltransferase involved in cell wall biosynthesis
LARISSQKIGSLDVCEKGILQGWAIDVSQPHRPVSLNIFVNKKLCLITRTGALRADVHKVHGLGENAGFSANVLPFLYDGQNIISAEFAEDQIKIPGYLFTHKAEQEPEKAGFEGHVDGVVGNSIQGWCVDMESPERPVNLGLFVDGELIKEVNTEHERFDISEQYQISAGAGFIFDLSAFKDRSKSVFEVREQQSGQHLVGSPFRLEEIASLSSPHVYEGEIDYSLNILNSKVTSVGKDRDAFSELIQQACASVLSGNPFSDESLVHNLKFIGGVDVELASQLAGAVSSITRHRHLLRVCSQALRKTGQISASLNCLNKAQNISPFPETFSEENLRHLLKIPVSLVDDHLGKPVRIHARSTAKAMGAKRIVYYVHHTEPYHQNGYTSRTSEVVSALNGEANVQIVSRLGFPEIVHGDEHSQGVEPFHIFEGTPVHVRPDAEKNIKKVFLHDYIEMATEDLIDFCRIHGSQCIHATSNFVSGTIAWRAAYALGIPFFYEMRGLWHETKGSRLPSFFESDEFLMHRTMEVKIAGKADHVFALNQSIKNYVANHGVNPDRISLVENAIDPNKFDSISKNRKPSADGKIRFGYIGSVVDYEGLELLLKAISEVDVVLRSNMELSIVGGGQEEEKLRRLTLDLELGDLVNWHGRVPKDQVLQFYETIDVFCIPRLDWAVTNLVTSLKQFEAMATGCAIFASDVDAISDVVKDPDHGWLFKAGSIDSAKAKLEDVLQNSSYADMRKRGDKAKNFVFDHHTWDKQTKPIIREYLKI